MFIMFLIFVTLALISTAAYFSVFGIASMFAYNYIPAMIMGLTLEAGKIVVAIYLFRYWTLMNRAFKYLMLTFLVSLMFITSVGIFGFLSQGYQETSKEFGRLSLDLSLLQDEYAKKATRLQDINNEILKLPSDSVTGKIRLSREFSDEQAELRDRLAAIEPRIQELKVKRLSYESHIGPIAYVARTLHAEQDNVVFFAILMLVFVADPLSITLTIACNMALMRYWEKLGPQADQVENSPMMFNHFASGIKAVASDYHNRYVSKKEAKKAARLAKEKAEAAKQADIERKAEEARRAEAAKQAEAERKAEAKRQDKLAKEAEKNRKKEEAIKAKLAKKAEEKRKAEEAIKAMLARQAEKKRNAEKAKMAAAVKKAKEKKAAAKKAEKLIKAEAEKKKIAKKAAPAKKSATAKKIVSSKKGKGRKTV
jgi:hypothetical protein